MKFTQVSLNDSFPLTCTRAGTCCHGNKVLLNPWELYRIASEKQLPTREFRDLYTDLNGIQLRFAGEHQWKGKSVYNQYVDGFGCSVHLGRPLACRLFPLGRHIQNNQVHYIYEGSQFPCLTDCPEVQDLPHLTVGEYLQGQETKMFEQAQDAYLELLQDLADLAFEFLLETGLTTAEKLGTLEVWNEMGKESSESLAQRLGTTWMDHLMIPMISTDAKHLNEPMTFIIEHAELLQLKIQENFGTSTTHAEFQSASIQIMGLSLQLARAIGTDPKALSEQWCEVASGYGTASQDAN